MKHLLLDFFSHFPKISGLNANWYLYMLLDAWRNYMSV